MAERKNEGYIINEALADKNFGIVQIHEAQGGFKTYETLQSFIDSSSLPQRFVKGQIIIYPSFFLSAMIK